MLNGRVNGMLVAMVAAALVAGCEVQGEPRARDNAPLAWYDGTLPILRFKNDPAHERGWVLTREGVVVFDFRTRRTLAHVPLPGWLWVGEPYACPPDLAIGPHGEVLVSSNVVPTLWRIDPVTFEVSRHEPALDQDANRDVGFSALSYSGKQGAYFGTSELQGTTWRIDPSLREARKLVGAARTPSCSS